jgi:hypothetical protein
MQLPPDMNLNLEKNPVSTGNDNKKNNAGNISNPIADSGYIGTISNITPHQLEKIKIKCISEYFKDYNERYFCRSFNNSDNTILKDRMDLNFIDVTVQHADQEDNNLTKNNNQVNSSNKQFENQPYLLQGKWELQVTKGNPESFKALIGLVKAQKILNVFGILNLRDTQYIQLNNMGNEIISGKVDLKSAGLINQTIKDVDTSITFEGFTQIRIDLDDTKTYPFFTKAIIVGTTEILVDGSGNVIIGPTPPQPSIQSEQRSVLIPHQSADKLLDEKKKIDS